MTMPDRIRQSVDAAVAAPVDTDVLLRRVRSAAARPRWIGPLAAAAAVVLAGGASFTLQDRATTTTPAAAGIVPFLQQRAGEGDVPPPDIAGPSSGPAVPSCTAADVTGRLSWTAVPDSPDDLSGQLRISLTDPAGAQPCSYSPDDPVLVLLGGTDGAVGPASTFVGLPDVPEPPRASRRIVSARRDLVVPLSLTGSNCVPSAVGSLSGMEPGLREVRFEGAELPCDSARPHADGTLRIGPPHTQGEPAAPLPADRQNLRITIDVPAELADGEDIRYLVRLTNPTEADISLSPCPAWQALLSRADSDGTTSNGIGGRLNCQAAPEAVPAGEAVTFEMVQPDPTLGQPGAKDATEVTLRWGIAGPEAATASIPLTRDRKSESATARADQVSYRLQYTGPVLIDGGSPDPQAEAVAAMQTCLELPGVEDVTEGVMLPANYRLQVVEGPERTAFERCANRILHWTVVDTASEKTFLVRPEGVPDVDAYASAMTGCLNLPGVGANGFTQTPPLSYVAYAAGDAAEDLQACLREVTGAAVEVRPGAPGSAIGRQEFIDRCVGGQPGAPAPEYLGLAEQQVSDAAAQRPGSVRVIGRDRVCLGRDDDLREERVNVILDDSRVVWSGRF